MQENLPKSTAHQFLYLNLFSPSGQSMNEDQTLHISFFIAEPAPSYSILKPCLCLGQQSLTLCIKTSSAVHASCICPLMYFRVKIIFVLDFSSWPHLPQKAPLLSIFSCHIFLPTPCYIALLHSTKKLSYVYLCQNPRSPLNVTLKGSLSFG